MPRGKDGETWTPTEDELKAILAAHAEWLQSEGQEPRRGTRADFGLANLSGADLTSAVLSGAILIWVDLSGAQLGKANLSGVKFVQANLSGAMLFSANLSGADLSGAKLVDATLFEADLSGADLSTANLSGAELVNANLSSATLRGTNLSGANLLKANLTDAKLINATMTGANLRWATLDRANLRAAKGVRLDDTSIRDTVFTAVSARWRAFFQNIVFPRTAGWANRRNWTRLGMWLERWPIPNDPWSILRQTYAGPQSLILYLWLLAFALPYVARVGFLSFTSSAEQKAADVYRRADRWLADHPDAAKGIPRLPPEAVEQAVREQTREQSVVAVLLKWDQGNPWPTALAVGLVTYNGLIYWLVSNVGPLRDEETRSGRSPRWDDYRWLYALHRFATGLFYVSLISGIVNYGELLFRTIRVPVSG